MRVYFDTNIWIDYLWGTHKGKKIKKPTGEVIDFIIGGKHKVVSSVFLFTEISSHFKDWYILNKIIEEGFSYRELANLKKRKKYSRLTKEQTREINSYLEGVAGLPWVDAVDLSGLGKEALDLFSTLTLDYYIDFADSFHILIAMDEKCRYLITKDEEMRDRASMFLDDYSLGEEFGVCRPEEFLAKVATERT